MLEYDKIFRGKGRIVMDFSNRISGLKPSAIREILKISHDDELVSLAAGNPAPSTFPVSEMAEIAREIFENDAANALQYGISEGFSPLRELTAERIRRKYNIGGENDDLIITSGGQQGIEMTAKVFLNENDAVICEDPSFIGALNAFRSYGARLIGVPTDDFGMRVDELEKVLEKEKNVKLIYTIPTFQNPTGTTLALERRKKLLELAEKYDLIIIEDSPYFELRFAGESVPPIKSMDTSGRVIFSGSYSKVLAPGIRIGYLCADKKIIEKLVIAKQVSDVHTNLFFQMIVAGYLEKCDIDEHIEQIRSVYRKKCSLMLSEMDRLFPDNVKFTRPEGGLFVWCTMPDGFDGCELISRAKEKKVTAVPGCAFAVDEEKVSTSFRLNFSLPSEDDIKKGIARLSEVLRDYIK